MKALNEMTTFLTIFCLLFYYLILYLSFSQMYDKFFVTSNSCPLAQKIKRSYINHMIYQVKPKKQSKSYNQYIYSKFFQASLYFQIENKKELQYQMIIFYSIIFLSIRLPMQKILLCIILISLATSQQTPACQVCTKVKQCDSSLLGDANIDPIYNSLIQQIQIQDFPTSILRVQDSTQCKYTFSWPSRAFLATVDLSTRAYSVVQTAPLTTVQNVQTALGVRTDSLVSNQAELIARIDADLRKKYSFGSEVKCVSISEVKGGYHAVYQRPDGTAISFDSIVTVNGNNVMISYQMCQQSANSSAQSSIQAVATKIVQPYAVSNSNLYVGISSTSSSSSSSSNANTNSGSSSSGSAVNTPAPTTVSPPPMTGGYSTISSNSQDVSQVINFLIAQIGATINQCSIVSVQRQTVNGFNYRLTLSFDSSSNAQYVIIVYKTISGQLTISSLNLINVQSTYTFSTPLTANQTATLSYLNALVTSLSSQISNILTPGTVIDAVYKSFPYFQLIFHNSQYQKITIIVLYDVLKNNATIISQNAVAYPVQQPTPIQPPVQPTPAPQPTPSPIIGGYSQISNPLNDQGVVSIINYLISSIGNIIKSATLVSAERQVVNGQNYRLTLSFDSSSTAQYVIVVYQPIQSQPSTTSIDLINVANTYSFNNALTSDQLSSLSYFNSLQNALVSQMSSVLTSGTVLDAVYKDFPYFQLNYHNTVYQQITVIVLYDLLKNSVTIIKQNTIQAPTPAPTPAPVPSTCNYAGYELICDDLRKASYIADYITYLGSTDSRYSISALSNIYWKISDHNSLKYVFTFPDGSFKEVNVGCDYIQYTITNNKSAPKHVVKLANCLKQSGSVCTRCANKFYLSKGTCNAVQVECSDFNYASNTCEGCYSGYYLDLTSVCRKADYLCQTSDRKGNCLTCFKDYRMTCKGKCAYVATGASDQYPDQENNPLCASFSKLTCLSCVRGCYMNAAGTCKIPDPNCDVFDQQNEICKVCMENYELSSTSRTCVPSERFY